MYYWYVALPHWVQEREETSLSCSLTVYTASIHKQVSLNTSSLCSSMDIDLHLARCTDSYNQVPIESFGAYVLQALVYIWHGAINRHHTVVVTYSIYVGRCWTIFPAFRIAVDVMTASSDGMPCSPLSSSFQDWIASSVMDNSQTILSWNHGRGGMQTTVPPLHWSGQATYVSLGGIGWYTFLCNKNSNVFTVLWFPSGPLQDVQ